MDTNKNKVVNVTLAGGLIGLFAGSPANALNKRIIKENQEGWKVVQVIPAATGNILVYLLRLILLTITLLFYTTSNGYYIVLEKQD